MAPITKKRAEAFAKHAVVLLITALWLYAGRQSLATARDFFQDYTSAVNVRSGMPAYTPIEESSRRHWGQAFAADISFNAHPPTSVLLALPFTILDYPAAALLWNVASWLMVTVAAKCFCREVGWSATYLHIFGFVTALMLLWPPMVSHMLQGQGSCLLLLLLTAAWICGRRRHGVACGLLLAIAALLKVYPAFLFIGFAVRRRWTVLISGLIGCVAVTLATGAVLGWSAYETYLKVVIPYLARWYPSPVNSSLTGFFTRLFAPDPRMTALVMNPTGAFALTAAATAVVIAVLVLVQFNAKPDFDGEFAASTSAGLIMSTLVWQHYFVILLLPLALTVARHGWKTVVHNRVIVASWLLMSIPVEVLQSLCFRLGWSGPVGSLTLMSVSFYGLVLYTGWQLVDLLPSVRAASNSQDSELIIRTQ